MKDFEFLEHTADLKFRATGGTLDECFENSARALWTAILKLETVTPMEQREIVSEATSLEVLLHDFLSELLFLFETQEMVFNDFRVKIRGDVKIRKDSSYILNATVGGEKINPERHKIETEIKAITYHEMLIVEDEEGWSATVLCDI